MKILFMTIIVVCMLGVIARQAYEIGVLQKQLQRLIDAQVRCTYEDNIA